MNSNTAFPKLIARSLSKPFAAAHVEDGYPNKQCRGGQEDDV